VTDRGVSTAVGYVLTLGITAVLVSGLLVAAGGVVEDRRDATSRDSLDVIGQRLASNLMSADRLAETRSAKTVAVDVALPARIAGSGYRIHVDGGSSTLILESDVGTVQRRVRFATTTPVTTTDVRGGALRIVLTPAGELEVRSA
jgi:hypothetical protein